MKLGRIQTYTGRMVDLSDLKPEDISIVDIAHALSNQCRFSGHTKFHFSVAQHSLNCSMIADQKYALEALLHDASEAYLVDIPRPLKTDDYRVLENIVMDVIARRFGFRWPMSDDVKEIDDRMLATEAEQLMLPPPEGFVESEDWMGRGIWPTPYLIPIAPMGPALAETAFLDQYRALMGLSKHQVLV